MVVVTILSGILRSPYDTDNVDLGHPSYEPEVEDVTDVFDSTNPDCNNEYGILSNTYRGSMAVTRTGLECMRWDIQFPHFHGISPENEADISKGIGSHNYCRNPDDEPNGAWCYTMDPKVRWEYCACGMY